MYYFFYTLPIHCTVFLFLLGISLWEGIRRLLCRSRLFRVGCLLAVVLWLYIVFGITVFSRNADTFEIFLIPLYQFWLVLNGGNPEVIRTFWMNMLMFAPCGFFLPELLPAAWSERRIRSFTVLTAAAVSLAVEVIQYTGHFGRAETDDVIANTLGVLLSLLLLSRLKKFTRQNLRRAAETVWPYLRQCLRRP